MTTTPTIDFPLPPTGPPHRQVIITDHVSIPQKPYGDTYRTTVVTICDYDYRGQLIDHDTTRAAFRADGDDDGEKAFFDDRRLRLIAEAVRQICGFDVQFDAETADRLVGNRWLSPWATIRRVDHSNMDSHFRGWWGDLKVVGDYTVSLTHTSPNCE